MIKLFIIFLIFIEFNNFYCKNFNFSLLINNVIDNYTNTVFCLYLYDLEKNEIIYYNDKYNIGNKKLPVGSIIKIYSIIAKFKNHPIDITESYYCYGWSEKIPYEARCWLKSGHKKQNLIQAIANSCNTYFYYFVQDIDFKLFIETLKEFGILNSSENFGRKIFSKDEQIMAMIGRLNFLKLNPIEIVKSLNEIFSKKSKIQREVKELLYDGMRHCYQYGTASTTREKLNIGIDLPIICKTGTGAYEENGKVDIKKTNGIFIGILDNIYLILVLVKNSVGAEIPSEIGLMVLKEIYYN